MPTDRYAALDAAIIKRLKRGPFGFTYILTGDVRAEVQRISDETGRDDFRILEARLQALRRAGRIDYGSAGKQRVWSMVEQP